MSRHGFHGDLDTLVTRSMAECLTRQLPRTKFHHVRNAGHLLTEHSDVIKQMRAVLLAEAMPDYSNRNAT